MNTIVSFALKKGISSIVILVDGQIVQRSVAKEKVTGSPYRDIISVFGKSLRLLRQYMNENDKVCEVCFETSNSVVASWFDRRECKKGYEEEFDSAMETLQGIPIYYRFSCKPATKAVQYCEEKYIEKEKLQGLEV